MDISSNRNQVTLGGLNTISVIYKDGSDEIDKIVYHLLTQDGWVRGVDTNADGVIDIRVFGRNYRHSATNDEIPNIGVRYPQATNEAPQQAREGSGLTAPHSTNEMTR